MAGSGTAHLRPEMHPILSVHDLVVEFPAKGGGRVHAVSGVSFDVLEGETLGVVGESGCGKSTTGRAVLQLPKPTSGSVRFAGTELTALDRQELRRVRVQMQMIFQDPVASLNPRRRVRELVAEGPSIWHRKVAGSVIDDILDAVGLDPGVVADRWPHELSGGQCQRVCIARALILDPKLLICDESVSALDVSVQAQILNLLKDMKARYRLTMIFVSHDLGVIKNISDRVVVMYLGKVCEVASSDDLYASPAHPYTRLLLESIPTTSAPADNGPASVAAADQPSAVEPPSGCRFRTRCPRAADRCASEEPTMGAVGPGHYVACHFPEPVQMTGAA
jgi:peptide/nickel transport system ATP-binding protein